jgi:hypothetical protein
MSEEIRVKIGARENITAFPTATEIKAALVGLREATLTLEHRIQVVIAASYYEYHDTGSLTTAAAVAGAGWTSGFAGSIGKALGNIQRVKPAGDTVTKTEAVSFAVDQAADIFGHLTKDRKAKLEAGRKRREEIKAEEKALKAENEVLKKAAAESDEDTSTTTEFALVGENGLVLCNIPAERMPEIQAAVMELLKSSGRPEHKVANLVG